LGKYICSILFFIKKRDLHILKLKMKVKGSKNFTGNECNNEQIYKENSSDSKRFFNKKKSPAWLAELF